MFEKPKKFRKRELSNLQFFEIAYLARSEDRSSKDTAKFTTSFGPLISSTVEAALEKMTFFPRVQTDSSYNIKNEHVMQ